MSGTVVAVSLSRRHSFTKPNALSIRLIEGLGVESDAHAGVTVKHRSRVAQDPSQPNLRQVHLIAEELLAELRARGFNVFPGAMGENVTTRGISLLDLPQGTQLHLGATAAVEVTGLRNPCRQLNTYQPGLMDAVLGRDEQGGLILRAGIMGIVRASGEIAVGDRIAITLPTGEKRALKRV